MEYEGYEALKVFRRDQIVEVRFNRPEKYNATDSQMHRELVRVFPEIGRDPDARVVILTGEGKYFSSGGDLTSMKLGLEDHGHWVSGMNEAREVLMGVIDLDVPVIARINGDANGMAANLALACDMTIADETAKISDSHVMIGLVAGDGGSILWPDLIGYARAKKYLLTGAPLTCAEAAAIGLITEAVPADQLDERVEELARRVIRVPTMAARLTKRAINMGLKRKMVDLMEAHLGLETMSHLSEDHAEAIHAFIEKRKPNFVGR